MSGPTTEVKLAVWLRDDWRCRYCDVELVRCGVDQPENAPNTATVDHVTPRAAGGSNALKNLVAACDRCNALKGDGPVARVAYAGPTLADVWPDLSDVERKLFGQVAPA